LLQAQGISYVVASDWIGADGFEDGLHLNDAGARIFSTRMAQTLAAPAAP
jgi:lysophospholipase L1-like esterase